MQNEPQDVSAASASAAAQRLGSPVKFDVGLSSSSNLSPLSSSSPARFPPGSYTTGDMGRSRKAVKFLPETMASHVVSNRPPSRNGDGLLEVNLITGTKAPYVGQKAYRETAPCPRQANGLPNGKPSGIMIRYLHARPCHHELGLTKL